MSPLQEACIEPEKIIACYWELDEKGDDLPQKRARIARIQGKRFSHLNTVFFCSF